MSITVADLKSLIDIGVTVYDDMSFYYNDGSDELVPIDDVGTLTLITNDNVSAKVSTSSFAFVASGEGDTSIVYDEFVTVLDKSSDDTLVYFINKIQSLPSTDEDPVLINYVKLEVDRLSGLSSKTAEKTTGVLTIFKDPLSSSSSSSI
jgi:hypothetical protein